MTDVSRFLEGVEKVSRSMCERHLVSIRQFGSTVDAEYRPGFSDIDIIVLVSDGCPPGMMQNLRDRLGILEAEFNIASVRSVGAVQRAFISRTALFKSHFVLHRSAIERQQYSRLFDEAEVLGLLGGSVLRGVLRRFLPWRLVIANIVSQSQLVWGTDNLET